MGSGIQLFLDLVAAETRLYNLVDDRVRAAHGASVGQVQLLGIIARTKDARVDDIVREVDIRTGTASKAVDRLEAGGWVRRAPNPNDRRSSLLTLTDSGAALLKAATPTFEEAVHALTDDVLSADELHALGSTLTKLRAALLRQKRRHLPWAG